MMKYFVLCEFGRHNKDVGDAIQRVLKKHGFESMSSYIIHAQMPLNIYHDKDNFKEGLCYIVREDYEKRNGLYLWNSYASIIADKCIDIWNTEKMKDIFKEKELLNNTCFKKYPVLKMSEH